MANVDCPRCKGRGETAVPGTYGPTVSPEVLELEPCWLCLGSGEVSKAAATAYNADVAYFAEQADL